ncbi:MAG: UDP-glucose 4-epimerase GalE [Candidatus Cloacimonadota bacterium]|nr:UDP-glucose 4-epimerase GalE [Candidatus Cloacimonadota bacterium]
MKVLVTGGSGFIGSHTCVELLERDYQIVVLDNLENSKFEAIRRVENITNKKIKFYKTDLRDYKDLETIFKTENIDSVIHFAGLKSVGESVEKPLEYFDNNLVGTIYLLQLMKKYDVKNLVFSSSATVYGEPKSVPIDETFPLSATNPYGQTKLIIEEMLRDIATANQDWNIILLRYFNPVGAHKSGDIGEDPNGKPNNLLPFISQVAVGKRKELTVFGDDYPTKDGTGVRDYIHVVDLSVGHIKALEKLKENPGIKAYNLGTGQGYSVLEMIKAFEKASGKKIPYKISERRAGDISTSFANPTLANRELDWEAKLGIDEICENSWNWQSKNPKGY